MKYIAILITIIQSILDRLPSRREKLLNDIQDIKDKLHDMQQKKTAWTTRDTVEYYNLTYQLSQLEKRATNNGK